MGSHNNEVKETSTGVEMKKVLAVGASLLLAGLTITCSLSLNNLMNAWFNYNFPEPDDLKKRVYYRLGFFVLVLIFVAIVTVLISNNLKVKQSLIDVDDFAQRLEP